MSKTKNISSFAELEKRKKELDLEVEVSKRELAHSLGQNRDQMKDFLVQRVALPAGIAIGGIWLLRKLTKKRRPDVVHERVVIEKEAPQRDEKQKEDNNHAPRNTRTRTVYPPRNQMRPSPRKAMAASPQPSPTPPPPQNRPVAPAPAHKKQPRQDNDQNEEQDTSFDMMKIFAVGRVLIPAGRMIFNAINQHKSALANTANEMTGNEPEAERIAEKSVTTNTEPLGAPTA